MTECPIYLDYHATTPIDPRVLEKMMHFFTTAFGNASSVDHVYGDEAELAVKEATKQVADLVGALRKQVIFTSGATESINLAIQGSIARNNSQKPKIAITPVEHKAVIDTCHTLAKKGKIELIELSVDRLGRVNLGEIEETCSKGLSLLCVMAANNEIGTIYPIEDIGKIAVKYRVPFLCDGSQAVGKIPVKFREWGITYLAISAHKMYGPKGSGALVVENTNYLEPMIFGGGHQKGLRSGTLNVPGIVGLGETCYLRNLEMDDDEKEIAKKRDLLQSLLVEKIPNLIINGDTKNRLAGSLHISIPGILNKAVIARIRSKLAISTGSACSSGVEAPSHVLRAINISEEVVNGSLRISIGKFTTKEEIHKSVKILIDSIANFKEAVCKNFNT